MSVSEQIDTAAVSPAPQPTQVDEDKFSPERVAARIAQYECLQALLAKGNSTSGRNGRPWREWLNDHEDES